MSNIIEDTAIYRIRAIEIAESEYYETLIRTLNKIERDIVALAGLKNTITGTVNNVTIIKL